MLTKRSAITHDKEATKARMSEIIDRLTPDQCEHFTYALEQVANCYLSSSSHGVSPPDEYSPNWPVEISPV